MADGQLVSGAAGESTGRNRKLDMLRLQQGMHLIIDVMRRQRQ